MAHATVNSPGISSIPADVPVRSELQKLVIGGLGGTAPIVATLMAGEYHNAAGAESAYLYYLGVCGRAALFFAVGAFFVWLHHAVRTRRAVFQLGVAAPAMIFAMVNTSPAESAQAAVLSDHGASTARAVSLTSAPGAPTVSEVLPPDVLFARCSFLDGLLGRKCDDDD